MSDSQATSDPAESEARARADAWTRAWLEACRAMPERCIALLERMDDDPEATVHGFRRATKAWRSLLRLAPEPLRAQADGVRGDVRALRRSLGASRDATVVATTLARLPSGRASALLMESARLVASRADAALPAQDRREEMAQHLHTLAGEMAGWQAAVQTMQHPHRHFLVTALEETYRKGRRIARRDLTRARLSRLHALRTVTIDLGYQLSLLEPAAPLTLGTWTLAAEALRGELGKIVDLEMVRENLNGIHVRRSGRKALAADIAKEMRRYRRNAQMRADSLFAERPKRFRALVSRVIETNDPVGKR